MIDVRGLTAVSAYVLAAVLTATPIGAAARAQGAEAAVAAPTAALVAPIPERRPVPIAQHGQTRIDDFAWLRDDNWQEVLRDPSVLRADVRAHLEAENAYQEAWTAGLEPLRETLFAEMRGRVQEDASTVPAPDGPFEYFVRYREGGEYPIYVRQPRGGGDEQVMLDGDLESGDSAFFSIGGVDHSPNHALMAYGVDRLGSEYYTIRIRNLETGAEYPDAIEDTDGGVVWAADSGSFFYVERDENQRPKRVKHHVLGNDPANDPVIYEEADDAFFLGLGKTQDGAFVLIGVGNNDSTEYHAIPADAPTTAPRLILPREPGLLYSGVEHRDGLFYILTNADDAVDFKVVTAPVADPSKANWTAFLPHTPGTQIDGLAIYKDFFVRQQRRDALNEIVVSTYDGDAHTITFDAGAYSLNLSGGYEYDTTTMRFTYEDMATPQQTFDYDMAAQTRTLRKTQEVPSGHNPDLYVVERVWAKAADGADIPISVLRLKTTPLDGSAPLLLYGYGSYGAFIPAGFSTTNLSLVDRGMIYALAHIRGGSDRGRQWYLDGKLDKKMNTFTDFNASANALVGAGYTSRGEIVSFGGSAGGLLVGAAVNLDPELYAGVLAAVPFVDVINTISDAELPLTPPEWVEWGNPITSAEEFGWIAAYSPYDNIQKGVAYPPIYATGGLTDYRVTYWEPAKWIARLRTEAAGGPFLLDMNMDAGHGGSAARFERLQERADLYAVALYLVGLWETAPVSHAAAE